MKLKDVLLIAAFAMMSALLSGCIIPLLGFGYTGYQYHEKEGVFAPGQPLGGPTPEDKSEKSSSSSSSTSKAPAPNPNNIE
jgi:hypothetical protein